MLSIAYELVISVMMQCASSGMCSCIHALTWVAVNAAVTIRYLSFSILVIVKSASTPPV